MSKFTINGKKYNFPNEMDEQILAQHPDAQRIEEAPMPSQSTAGGIGNAAWRFGKGLGLGAVQGIGDVGASVLNTPAAIGSLFGAELPRVPHPDLKKQTGMDVNDLAYFLGQFATPGVGVIKGLSLANKIARPAGKLGIATDLAKGIGLGYAGGEHTDEGSRIPGAVLGGVGNVVQQITKPAILKRILTDEKKAEQRANKEYGSVFEGAKKSGVESIPMPKLELTNVLKKAKKDYKDTLSNFERNPTIKGAHEAQSDLGKMIRDLQAKDTRRGLSTVEQKALNEAQEAQKKLKGSIHTGLTGNEKTKHLAKAYQQAAENYKKKNVPYMEAKGLQKYHGKKAKAGTAAKMLSQDEAFRIALKQYDPDFFANALLPKNLVDAAIKYMRGPAK